MRRWLFFLLLVILLAPSLSHAELLFPLQTTPSISSNFGQYRTGHPHGGVDLWTFLKIGVPVLAADDGYVFRLRCSPTGYGRVVYQRLADGRIAVYAHLAGFAPKIEKAVQRIQAQNGRYSFNQILGGNEVIRVKRGEVIAYAGDTGTDVPHLHFEIRDRDGFPINPLTAGFPYTDNRPPVLAALHAEPLTWDAHVNNSKKDVIVSFQRQSDGAYTCSPLTIGGRVGLSVNAYDLVNGSPRQLAPYHIKLLIDGRERFVHRFARFNYAETYVSSLSYIYRLKVQRKGRFIRLFRLHEKTVFHPFAGTGDLSTLTPGEHQVVIVVTDEKGLKSRAGFALRVESSETVDTTTAVPADITADTLTGAKVEWRGDHVVVRFNNSEPSIPAIAAETISRQQRQAIKQVWVRKNGRQLVLAVPLPLSEDGVLRLFFTWTAQTKKLLLPYSIARNGRKISSPDNRARIDVPAGALFTPVAMPVEAINVRAPRWLEPVGSAYRFDAQWQPLRKKLHVSLTPPADAAKNRLGVYLYDKGTWWHMQAGTQAKIPAFATYALARDIARPAIGEFVAGPGRQPTLKVTVSDLGSGLAEQGIDVRLDGRSQIFEYVPYKRHLLVRVNNPLSRGDHTLQVTLRDRAGNATTKMFRFSR